MITELFALIFLHQSSSSSLPLIQPSPIDQKYGLNSTPINEISYINSELSVEHYVAPTPQPVVAPANLSELFLTYSKQYNVETSLLIKIAQCESGLNPSARALSYLGLYQFAPTTWSAYRTRMHEDPNPELRTDPEASIKTAAYMISVGQVGAWPTCSK